MERGVFSILFGGIMTLLIFIILVISLNVMTDYVSNNIFQNFVVFFNNNVLILVWIALIMTVAELLFVLKFPFNLPAPCFNAVGGLLIVTFLGNLFIFLRDLGSMDWNLPLQQIFFIISLAVFFIVLIVGYYNIFKNTTVFRQRLVRKEPEEDYEEGEEEDYEEEKTKEPVKKVKQKPKAKQKQVKKTAKTKPKQIKKGKKSSKK